MNKEIKKIVEDAENEVKQEGMEEKKEQLKNVLREIQESKEITRRLEAKKERLIADLA